MVNYLLKLIEANKKYEYTKCERFLTRRSLMDDGIVEIRPTNFDFT